jgi:hypothetical protein
VSVLALVLATVCACPCPVDVLRWSAGTGGVRTSGDDRPDSGVTLIAPVSPWSVPLPSKAFEGWAESLGSPAKCTRAPGPSIPMNPLGSAKRGTTRVAVNLVASPSADDGRSCVVDDDRGSESTCPLTSQHPDLSDTKRNNRVFDGRGSRLMRRLTQYRVRGCCPPAHSEIVLLARYPTWSMSQAAGSARRCEPGRALMAVRRRRPAARLASLAWERVLRRETL